MNTIGLIGSLLLAFCSIPELYRTIKDGRCHIGWGFMLMWFFGEVLCLFYVIGLKELPLILNYGFNVVILIIMLYYKLRSLK